MEPTLEKTKEKCHTFHVQDFLQNFCFTAGQDNLFEDWRPKVRIEYIETDGKKYPRFINEYWTAKQRQAHSLHEVAYRACFKPQLPRFFIELFTKEGDIVFDPFSGRGTTVLEAALLRRNIIANDINPLSSIFSRARLKVPTIKALYKRLEEIKINKRAKADIDLSMFYHPETEAEIVSLKRYLNQDGGDYIDDWIRMVATNRLTGHSSGFFSVYTLPPNQAVTPNSQIKINQKRNQIPDYRDTKDIILRKTISLTKDVTEAEKEILKHVARKAQFINVDAREIDMIRNESVQLTVTSPPFLDVVQYANDNWLRCWFNNIDAQLIAEKITMSKTVLQWKEVMGAVFRQLYRITKKGGWVAFEVGEVRGGKIKLDEYVIPLGLSAGFNCEGVLVNEQIFTKTANIWGIQNNTKGTNSNRVVIFNKQ